MHNPQPDEQIAAMVDDFFAPPAVTEAEYEITLRQIATEMVDVSIPLIAEAIAIVFTVMVAVLVCGLKVGAI